MRVFAFTLLLTAFFGGFASDVNDNVPEPDLVITAHFPEENPFHHVVNGEKNSLYLIVENKSELNSTLKSVAGSFHDLESQVLVRNITSLTIPMHSIAGSKLSIPFSFHNELKPGDYSLRVWVDHVANEILYRVMAYDGIVTVVEPEASIFDFKMISTYIITALIVVGGAYFAVISLFPSLLKPKRKRVPRPSEADTAPAGAVKSSGTGYEEEWIPDHHLKKPTSRRGQKKANSEGAPSSGDENAGNIGAESGSDGLRRSKRGKKA